MCEGGAREGGIHVRAAGGAQGHSLQALGHARSRGCLLLNVAGGGHCCITLLHPMSRQDFEVFANI